MKWTITQRPAREGEHYWEYNDQNDLCTLRVSHDFTTPEQAARAMAAINSLHENGWDVPERVRTEYVQGPVVYRDNPRPQPTMRADSLDVCIKALFADGRKIDAIKLYREFNHQNGVGLKEAKDYCERLVEQQENGTSLGDILAEALKSRENG